MLTKFKTKLFAAREGSGEGKEKEEKEEEGMEKEIAEETKEGNW